MFPEDARAGMNRRNFLRLGGLSVAGAALLGTGGAALGQTSSALDATFKDAANEYGVPRELLKAMGYVNTGWEMPPPQPYDPEDLQGTGTYGILQLRRVPSQDTLGKAASLTGLSVRKLKTNRSSNILGGAAVLSAIAGRDRPTDLNGWREIVSEYDGSVLYANAVYNALQNGASTTISTGERIELSPRPEAETSVVPMSRTKADYGRATWYGNNNGRNRTNRDRGREQIDKIVVHVGQNDYWSIINWFRRPDNTGSSAHYTVGRGGGIGQSVWEEDIAWHAGWWDTNKKSIGIEHAGYVGNPKYWFTDKMYDASARLSASLCKRYGIPVKRKTIIGHNQVPGCSGSGGGVSCHTDPGKGWNWDKYMRRVAYYRKRV